MHTYTPLHLLLPCQQYPVTRLLLCQSPGPAQSCSPLPQAVLVSCPGSGFNQVRDPESSTGPRPQSLNRCSLSDPSNTCSRRRTGRLGGISQPAPSTGAQRASNLFKTTQQVGGQDARNWPGASWVRARTQPQTWDAAGPAQRQPTGKDSWGESCVQAPEPTPSPLPSPDSTFADPQACCCASGY